MDSLSYQLDELNTRIALLKQAVRDANSDDMIHLVNRLNALKVKREAIRQRRQRLNAKYRARVYEPDITVMR
jgi:hypothetical protein